MKIEKKKITERRPLSIVTKTAIAATLGMAAAFSLNACDDSSSPGSEEPLGGDMPPEDVIPPESSDSQTAGSSSEAATPASSNETAGPETSSETVTPASSSQIVDIPLSHEAVSSSVQEALSSLMESSSSEAAPASSEAAPASSAVAPESSSDVVPPVSSEAAPTSSETATSSSSYVQWGPIGSSSSSQNGWVQPRSSSVDYSEECPDNDPYCIHVHMCQDHPEGCMAASMVTTFERDDITG